jgi:outer membrane receptor protein involved in Fe transport
LQAAALPASIAHPVRAARRTESAPPAPDRHGVGPVPALCAWRRLGGHDVSRGPLATGELDAIRADLQNTSLAAQQAIEANLTGSLADLPAGRLQFALGAGYRQNSFSYTGDSLINKNAITEQTLLLFPVTNSSGSQSVTELYGELLIPVAPRFDLELGGRYSDYDTSGGVDTYKVLGDWRMTDFARLRGGFNRATRAPNIAELFLRSTQSAGAFGAPPPLYADPCTLNPETASPAPVGGP